ncbi:MAG: type II toxin-antitoxin system VapC family toxin, partial [Spirochaetales bacterium]|nr:type II toxin-antitoxin system VapC family toxin [Spirochaetales bacterium]
RPVVRTGRGAMKYWDSSAILPLLVEEPDSSRRRASLESDSEILTWWGSSVECVSAMNRLLREGALDENGYERVLGHLEELSAGWIEVQATEKVRQRALRLLRVHPLRAADALQLAAALVGSGEAPRTLPFACADPRLNEAARREGFPLAE